MSDDSSLTEMQQLVDAAIPDYIVASPLPLPWYRRTSVLVSFAVAVFLAACVVVDLPAHTTVGADISNQKSVISQINSAISECAYAIKETYLIDDGLRHSTLSSNERSQAPVLLRDDQTACSFSSSSIYDLSNIEGTGTAAGKDVGDVVNTTTVWATADALAIIEDVQSIVEGHSSPSLLRNLSNSSVSLGRDRALAFTQIRDADRILHTTLPWPDLPKLPVIPPPVG